MATKPRRSKARKSGAPALKDYADKRDFATTSEPAGGRRRRSKGRRFVVQEHSARRLHWDLRLERDGVAASWAIPNGIPLDPEEDRKAVHTEDHPLEYLDFEGEIPKGQYGAGTMRIWDRGTYECHAWEAAKVVLSFSGERLSGRYALFRAGSQEKDWMIHRIDRPAERRDPFPESLLPMLPRPGRLPARDRGWAAEIRWAGTRAFAYCRPGRLELVDRNLAAITADHPQVRRLARQIGARDAVLDGVMVDFGATVPTTYVIFDLLYLDGRDLTGEPYRRRRRLLAELGLDGPAWQTPDHSTGHAKALLGASAERGLGGVVLKRLDSPYRPGQRSGDWIEVDGDGPARPPSPAAVAVGASDAKKKAVTVDGRELRLSNLGKVLYPKTGFTKGQLIEWYARMAPVLLPHLRGRPLTLKRYPNGVEGGHFYEKRCPGHRPDWVRTARVWSERHREEIDYCLVDDLPTLIWAANLADIEMHTSLSLAAAIERPTAVVFDLDPGAPAGVLDCAQVALWLHGMFEQMGLSAYVKTSGSKGLQLYLPLNGDVSYERTKPFAKAVAETLERRFPERVVSRMAKSAREGKVLIDWSQNDRHKTTACVYSLRAKAEPMASTPLEWEELESALAAGEAGWLAFDHAAALRRVDQRGDLFAPLLSRRQELPDLQ
jgi:bifunctional non-homologous end joining protein LigD